MVRQTWSMRQRSPIFPPWSKSECPDCADPIEYAVLDVHNEARRVAIIRKVDAAGTIAVRWIGDQLHGYTITDFRPLQDGFVRVKLHELVCKEAVRPAEQRPLF